MLGTLLILLCTLAVVQHHWINKLAEAQRQSAKASLSAALSNVESDFDIEITRAFVAFQLPFANLEYSERYQEWLLHAPYPNLIRGIYIAEPGQNDSRRATDPFQRVAARVAKTRTAVRGHHDFFSSVRSAGFSSVLSGCKRRRIRFA